MNFSAGRIAILCHTVEELRVQLMLMTTELHEEELETARKELSNSQNKTLEQSELYDYVIEKIDFAILERDNRKATVRERIESEAGQ